MSTPQKNSIILKWLKRIISTVILLEIIYLIIFNAALNITYTQLLVNKIKPDKFKIYWQSAWTPYPLRIHAKGFSITGESKTQEWQVNAKSASASVSILPLLKRNLKIHSIVGENAEYFQRPKIKPNKDYSKVEKYFPLIKDRDANKMATLGTTFKPGKSWKIDIDDISAHGDHKFWLYQIKGDMSGDLHASISIQTRGGPFSIQKGKMNITLNALQIKGGDELMKETQINGKFELAPVVFAKNKGIKIISFLTIDSHITGHMGSLDYLSTYLKPLQDIQLHGQGMLSGRLSFAKGVLLEGTDLKIDTTKLTMSALDYRVEGDCRIGLNVTTDQPDGLEVGILYNDLRTYVEKDQHDHNKSEIPFIDGKSLSIKAIGSPVIFPHDSNSSLNQLFVDIPAVTVDNLNVFQRYIPHKWPFKIYEGQGELNAKGTFKANSFEAEIKILSTATDIDINEHRFKSDLDFLFKLKAQSEKSLDINMSGSYLSLKNSRLINEKPSDKRKSELWDTTLNIDKGAITLQTEGLLDENNQTENLFVLLKKHKLRELLSNTNAELKIAGDISQIEWMDLLLKNSLDLSFSGSGKVNIDLLLEKGLPAKGSIVKLKPKDLKVSMLDYHFKGDADIVLKVEKGGESPNLGFDLRLQKGLLKRKHEKHSVISNVTLELQGIAKNLSHNGPKEELELHVKIPSAEVENIFAYNHYLPKNSPLKFIKGYANLTADIKLKHNDAKGFIKLSAKDITMLVDEEKIITKLALDVKLRKGIPKKMKYDISGTTIKLYDTKVIGRKTSYQKKGWSASAVLDKAHVVWKKPVKLDLKAKVKIKDTRPFVALLDNEHKEYSWVSHMLTVEDIHGVADLKISNNIILIPYLFFQSKHVELGAKGIISPKLRDGIFYFRDKIFTSTLKTRNGTKHFGILHSKKKFDDYVIPH